ncbi:hypothetical protein G6O69_24215 [Pseudenhygromyxa sp. WMMC2535]|uniref:hypothetical protein n=1 Tax=Pseudenhygromyxa sp. WMMC2535 TaxID=2712867 RepID=UPI001556883A|nr:hypothetical protein [Pseudenhygromyxa sp. WMMC2535]NVB40967.1 hypothetical protein [Pseudenhygromyxa sp. WMMC2535]
MNEEQARRVVGDINAYLQQKLWFDFEVMEYQGDTLTIMGSLDISAPHDVEIRFKGVFFVSLPLEWKTDTATPPLRLMAGEEAVGLNQRFKVEQGHHIFRFTPEYYPEDFGCLVCAQAVSFEVMTPVS